MGAPDPAAVIDWPATFGQRFTVTVDTEEDFDWAAPLARTGAGTASVEALIAGHRRLVDHGALPAYMVDWPIIDDPRAAAVIATLHREHRAVIGAQLHPWVNPPFDEVVTPFNSFPGNLPESLEAAKLDRLTTAIGEAIGSPPRSYRAGRYGIGPRTLGLLAARGYRLDSSVRSRYDYTAAGGPDFGAVGNDAYRIGDMVELPLTTVHLGRLRRGGERLYRQLGRLPHARGLFARTGLLSRVALTPEDMPLAEVLEAIRIVAGEGLAMLNFSFHSPSLVPGNTPYVRDEADLAAFHHWWDAVLALLARLDIRAITLDDVIAAADSALASAATPA